VPNKDLAIYLKDHHAGSEAALAILDHIEEVHGEGAAGDMVRRLRPEFIAERQVLTTLLGMLDDASSLPRRMFGWLSEKGLELKLKADDASEGPLHLLESTEMLALGVHGKAGLWRALNASRDLESSLATVEYEPLISQAEAQRALIETVRMGAARSAIMK
jgi:hypothetical protein